jgi:hypothetical protein
MIFIPDIENVIAIVMMIGRLDAGEFAFWIEPAADAWHSTPGSSAWERGTLSQVDEPEGFGMPKIEDSAGTKGRR